MDKQSADILRRAKALIDHPSKWCKGSAERDAADGLPKAYCMMGALWKAGVPFVAGAPLPMPIRLIMQIVPTIPVFNDHPKTTHSQVLYVFDRAIALAEGRISDEAYTARFISEVVESVKSQEVATAK